MPFFKKYLYVLFLYTLTGCTTSIPPKSNVNIFLNKNDIEFNFTDSKSVLVYHYEINDYENFENNGLTYKRLYNSSEINKKIKKITFNNYSEKIY